MVDIETHKLITIRVTIGSQAMSLAMFPRAYVGVAGVGVEILPMTVILTVVEVALVPVWSAVGGWMGMVEF